MNYPGISVIIVCRNEEKYIEACINSIFENNSAYPLELIEMLVVDGMSTDATRERITHLKRKFPQIRLLDNPKKYSPSGRNVGIKAAQNDFLFLLDAHAQYPQNYLSLCITGLQKYKADCVGVGLEAQSKTHGVIAESIAGCFEYGSGAQSDFRTQLTEPKEVDTIFSGCYKREVFNEVGLYNEKLIRSQDMDLSIRMKKKGKTILQLPGEPIRYYTRSTFGAFVRQNSIDGVWATYPLKFGVKLKLRHYIPLFFVLFLIGGGVVTHYLPILTLPYLAILALYLLIIVKAGIENARRKKRLILAPITMFMLLTRHVIYGLGSLVGLLKIATW